MNIHQQLMMCYGKKVPLPTWALALAAVRSGTGRAKVACIGDSTTAGYGATAADSGYGSGLANSYPAQLASKFAAKSVGNNFSAAFGFQNADPALHPSWSSQLVFGTNWKVDATQPSLGGPLIRFNGAGAGTLSFTPAVTFDTFRVFYVSYGSNGQFTVSVDSGASLATISTSTGVANGLVSVQAFTTTLGTHTIKLNALANGDVYILGIEAYNSASVAVDIWNMGWGGSLASNYNASGSFAWRPQSAIAVADPDLTIFSCTINDWVANTSITTYKSNMQVFINAAKAVGDVLLLTGVPSNTSSAPASRQDTFVQALQDLANSNGVPMISMIGRWGDWSSRNSLGWYYDNLHPNQIGYGEIAQAVADFVLSY